MKDIIERQKQWSEKTFGQGRFTGAITDHIRKELKEVERDPVLEEWVDVILLGVDGAWRTGASAEEIIHALNQKITINELRKWPKTVTQYKAIEHLR